MKRMIMICLRKGRAGKRVDKVKRESECKGKKRSIH